jgi:hypothetical protein
MCSALSSKRLGARYQLYGMCALNSISISISMKGLAAAASALQHHEFIQVDKQLQALLATHLHQPWP